MRRRRLFLPAPIVPGSVRPLDEPSRHYLRDVLRLDDGAELVVFDGTAGAWTACLGRDQSGTHALTIGERLPDPGADPALPIVLVQALTHTRSIDEVVARATEIGVETIIPVFSARGRIRLATEHAGRRRSRWCAVATSAARQCGRTRVPNCTEPLPLAHALTALPAAVHDEHRILLSPEAPRPFAADARETPSRLVFMIGPEGGWTQEERELAARYGFEPRRFGPRILRTGTAGLAVLAAAGVLWGDLGD